jgi:hypothetical protein
VTKTIPDNINDSFGLAAFPPAQIGIAGRIQTSEQADARDAEGARTNQHDLSEALSSFSPIAVPGLPSTGQNGQPTRNAATVQDVADRATQSSYGDDDA